jgi:hypothetical protein
MGDAAAGIRLRLTSGFTIACAKGHARPVRDHFRAGLITRTLARFLKTMTSLALPPRFPPGVMHELPRSLFCPGPALP